MKKTIVTENKNIYDSISKIGKSITKCKTFKDAPTGADLDLICFRKDTPRGAVNELIAKHLFVNGRFNPGEEFCYEAEILLADSYKQTFRVLDSILNQVQQKELQGMIDWVDDNIHRLKIVGSDVPFLMNKVRF